MSSGLSRWTAAVAILMLAGLSVFRIADTYPIFNNTYDEPAHIAAGMEVARSWSIHL